jgi:hypothetical protein
MRIDHSKPCTNFQNGYRKLPALIERPCGRAMNAENLSGLSEAHGGPRRDLLYQAFTLREIRPALSSLHRSPCAIRLLTIDNVFHRSCRLGSHNLGVFGWSHGAPLWGARFSPFICRATLLGTYRTGNFEYVRNCFLSPGIATI